MYKSDKKLFSASYKKTLIYLVNMLSFFPWNGVESETHFSVKLKVDVRCDEAVILWTTQIGTD